MKKKFKSIVIILALDMLLSACGTSVYSPDSDLLYRYKDTPVPSDSSSSLTPTPVNPDAIIGVWKLIEVNGDVPRGFEETLTFSDDNTCLIVINASSEACTYTFNNNILTLKAPSKIDEYSVQFNNGQMTLSANNIIKTYMLIVYW